MASNDRSSASTSRKKDKTKLDRHVKKEIKRRLGSEARKEIASLAVGTVAMIGSALSNQAVPRLLGKVLDGHKTSSSSISSSPQSCPVGEATNLSSLAVVVLGGGLASFLRTVCLNNAQTRIAARLRSRLFGSLLVQRDLEFYQSDGVVVTTDTSENAEETLGKESGDGKDSEEDKATKVRGGVPAVPTTPGSIGTVLSSDVTQVSEILTTTLANAVRSTCSVTFATLNMLKINPSLLGLSVSIVPLIGSAAVILNKFVKKATTKQSEIQAEAASFAEERLSNIATVKTSCREADEVSKYDEMQSQISRLGQSVSFAKGTFMGFMFAASSGALFLVFRSGGRAVSAGKMTSGQLTSFATYTFLLGLGTSGLMKASGELGQGLVCAARMYGLIDGGEVVVAETKKASRDAEVLVEDKASGVCGAGEVDPAQAQSISVQNVSFAYRSHPEKTVLREVSIQIKRGQVVALVGKNGSGKSTLASLLSALYRPQSGTITLSDGTDLYSLSRRAQSHLVQAVPQHPAFFDMTIGENVTYSNPEASDSEVAQALTTANCDGFLSKLNEGTAYKVGRNGSKLSGGQRQRLALARALLSDPCCLILDEPSSSLDAEGETAVADAVAACRRENRGLLLITHRVKTLELADDIVVLKDGSVVEQGNYARLKNKKDSELCNLMPDLL